METKRCRICGEEQPLKVFHRRCHICNKCRYQRDKVHNKRAAKRRHIRLRTAVFEAHGAECTCCGESRQTMLCLDHVNNDGAEHRRSLQCNGGTKLYADVVSRDFPFGFQILCMNCNSSKARNGGVCEHQTERATTIPKGSRADKRLARSARHLNQVKR